jgi:hypothetical protein
MSASPPKRHHEKDMQDMSDLCCWPTPNGHKITIFPEEAALDGPLPAHRPAWPKARDGMAVLAGGQARADGRAEPPFRGSTHPRRSLIRSTATSRRSTGSMMSWIGDLPASLIWRPIRGSCHGSGSSITSTTSSICAAGSTASTTALPRRDYDKGEPFSGQPTVAEEGKKLVFGQAATSVVKA